MSTKGLARREFTDDEKENLCVRGTEVNIDCPTQEGYDSLPQRASLDGRNFNKSHYDGQGGLAWYRLAPARVAHFSL